jgi:curved DNA-binding protein
MGGGPNGDLFLEVHFESHAKFTAQGKDVFVTVPITPWEAALGATVQVPTLEGAKLGVKIPAGSQSGKKLRLKGKGIPAKVPGDQYAVLQVVVPAADTDEKKKLYEEMAKEMAFDPREGVAQ